MKNRGKQSLNVYENELNVVKHQKDQLEERVEDLRKTMMAKDKANEVESNDHLAQIDELKSRNDDLERNNERLQARLCELAESFGRLETHCQGLTASNL